MALKAYRINIVGLSNGIHHFDFEIGNEFFLQYGAELVQEGSFTVHIQLDKHETFLEVEFDINGAAKLLCDRSLEPFDFPIENSYKVVFKYGDEDKELTEEIIMISRETVTLELGQYIYEFIALAIPMKKLHPKFQDDDEGEGKIIYSSSDNDKNEDENIDPRWDQLKKLK